MSEHEFDMTTVARWREAADRARTEWCAWTSVSERASPAANASVLELKLLLAQSVGKIVAEWATTNWLITGRPIEECVAEELLEKRPWPSPTGRLRGQLAPPSH